MLDQCKGPRGYNINLVGGFNPPEKYESQIGSSSQLLGKKCSKPPTSFPLDPIRSSSLSIPLDPIRSLPETYMNYLSG